MNSLLIQHSNLIRRLRRKNSGVKVQELKQFFDNLILFIRNLTYTHKKTDGLDILTIICDDLASINTLQLFDHPVLINHPIFIYIGRTLEMLLTKSNHSKSIPMKNHEENCFYSISYFITQLCYYRNETIELFYGSISNEVFPVTGKINIRDETINENSRKSNPITGKPNLKISSLPPSAPKSRPIEQRQLDITEIIHRKKFSEQIISPSDGKITEISISLPTDLPSKKYQDIFLTKSFLDKLIRAIEDLSQNDYSPYHIKYKVIDRLVRLCSKLNIIDQLLDPIIKCLRSKFYLQVCTTIQLEQLFFNPKQLFFIYQCPQFIIQHKFQRQEQIPNLLCQTMIEVTKPIADVILSTNEYEIDSTYYYARAMAFHTLRCHLEFLNYFSLTSSGRRYFSQSYIIDQMINILCNDVLISNGDKLEELLYAYVGIITNALMILCNLAYEKQMFLMLKKKDLKNLFSGFQGAKDNMIPFALETLSTILNENEIDEENEPMKLKEAYIEHLNQDIIESKQTVKVDTRKKIRGKFIFKKLRVIFCLKIEFDIKYNFFRGPMLEKLIEVIKDFSITEYPENKVEYKTVGQRVRVCARQDNEEVKSLLDPILQCLDSEFYLQVFENIELSNIKDASGAMSSHRGLAMKHLFFMRECPEFLFRHDYKRQDEVVDLLGQKMLGYTQTIFENHLSILIEEEGKRNIDKNRAARMEALSYHIKMLNHFAQIRSMRPEFSSTSIIDEILLILQNRSLFDRNGRINDVKLGAIGQSLTLLYNLSFEKTILTKLRTTDIFNVCLKLRDTKDKIIHFTSHILLTMLNHDQYDKINDIPLLSRTCIEYVDKSVKEPRLSYQSIKLDGLLKNLKSKLKQRETFFILLFYIVYVQNDLLSEKLSDKKEDGIPVIAKCVYINCPEGLDLNMIKKIQQLAVDIIWRLSFYGPTTCQKLKSNDLFIEQLLILLKETSSKSRKTADAIIWRLGNEESFRSEQTQKENSKSIDDDQLPLTNEWDDSISYDLIISDSSDPNDKILSMKIYKRLVAKGYRIYTEKLGKHRLELIQKAVAKKKPILACLSTRYRASKFCMAEIEYANKRLSPIIPIIVGGNYKVQGWLKHIVSEKHAIDFTEKNFDNALLKLIVEIDNLKSSD